MTSTEVLKYLKRHGRKRNIETMKHFGIDTPKAFGVTAPVVRKLAKQIGTDHPLAQKLWRTGFHEARVIAALIADPDKTTISMMEQWVNDFDSWALCDACCGELFDYTSYAVAQAQAWSTRRKEFVKRAGFVLMAELAVHDTSMENSVFVSFFPLIERESTDKRNFVKKAVNWALRQIGKRNVFLHSRAMTMAKTLSRHPDSTAQWIGTDALKELRSDIVRRRLIRKKK